MTITRVNLCLRPALKNAAGLNAPWFSAGWTRSTALHATLPRTTGIAGSTATAVRTAPAPVTPGKPYVGSVSLRAVAACSGTHGLLWYNGSDVQIAASATSTYSAGASTTQRLTTAALTAPAGATHCRMVVNVPAASMQLTACLIEQTATTGGTYFDGDDSGATWVGVNGDSASYLGTPDAAMTLTASYDDRLGRVRVFTGGASSIAGRAYVQRRPLRGSTWSDVRGGLLPLTGGASVRSADDYEYPADVSLVYRASGVLGIGGGVPANATGGVAVAELVTDSPAETFFSPPLVRSWLKFVAAPHYNRKVTILAPLPEITRPSRNAVYEVRERNEPVIVTAGHSSRRMTLKLATFDQQETAALDESLRQGIPGFLHTPADLDLPSLYVVFGDYRYQVNRQTGKAFWEIPVTEVSAPPSSVFGTGATWQTVLSGNATWNAVLTGAATWRLVTS